ncbi:heavy-metal-associated domain-containing protein [Roseicella aerolata]|uniref:Heavy-metal-associated domain-containing protein n=1 Tax=Roseicella aerolata TaxID=2883479 RepID=A0A9X1IK82_9PROT|nr:heavy-metal-associated domain-containing protein [Roseicella aerolata]MCB4824923.1 heavy-metal-associated domain-containing protein [Roseicella aerolata]
MQRFKVPDMNCGHCVRTITEAIRGLDPKAEVEVSLDRREVAVATDADPARISGALREAGYESERMAAA